MKVKFVEIGHQCCNDPLFFPLLFMVNIHIQYYSIVLSVQSINCLLPLMN